MNTKINKYLLLLITCTALLFAACGDEFLNVENPNAVSIGTFYENDEQATQALMGVYDILQWEYGSDGQGGWSSTILTKTLPTDEGTAGGTDSGDQGQYQALNDYTFDAQNTGVQGVWGKYYFGVYRANLVINNVDPAASPLRKQIVAEAKALRAYYYLELVSMFGDVPLILQELAQDEYNQSRVDKTEIYQQIEQDLNEAIPELPLKSAYGASDKFRVSKGTAQAILGKSKLYTADYQDAVNAFESIIGSGEYALVEDFASIFDAAGEFGPGSLLEASFTSTQYGSGFDWNGNTREYANLHIQLMGARGDNFTFSPTDSLAAGWGFNYPTEKIYNAFMEEGDEFRRKATLMTEQEFLDDGGQIIEGAYQYEGFLRRKYGTFQDESNENDIAGNYGTNWRLIRYADVLLMAAEANYRIGNEVAATGYLNQVRQRAQIANVTASGEELLNAIVKERYLELAFEGHRLQDLNRWGLGAQALGGEGFVSGKHELFPIPDVAITASPNLTQNPGF